MTIKLMTLAATTFVLSTSVNAALIERLGGLAYYDDVADLTWLADANYAQTSGYRVDGRMGWADANAWVDSLIVDGADGWRLANSDTCTLYDCADSEMGNLFYNVLGNTRFTHYSSAINTGPFENVQPWYYWSATEYESDTSRAYAFNMLDGFQYNYANGNGFNAWAVQSGDVSAVPVPAAAWLFGSGLVGLVGFARRKRA